jgi:UDP-2-acetamido-2-deoxy-ribo-hexuluronate aminotransferase
MEFVDLKNQYEIVKYSVLDRINTVLRHGKFIMGPEVKELEDRLASYVDCQHCVSCSSGTDALLMSLMAYDLGPGDAIFTTPFTFIATAEVISLLGATPIFVDIEEKTFNINAKKLKKAIKDVHEGKFSGRGINKSLQPKGIIAVDLFGLPADYDAINEVAKEYGLYVIEDAAQSFGGGYRGKKACNLADVAATSFFPAKPLGCYGDGGAVLTNSNEIAQRIRSLRVHGKGQHKYDNVRIGINGRLDTLQAGILLAKLEVFDEENEKRQRVADIYTQGLKNTVTVPFVPSGYESAWAQYSVITKNRDRLIQRLSTENIPTAIYYPTPLHLQTAFSFLGYKIGDFPISERVSNEILSLPMHPYLTHDDQKIIINVFQKG